MTDKKDIGYGRPPVDTRWKKGQSGNPKGRPKSRPENLADAAAILAEPVTAQTPDGRRIRLDAIEAGYLALCRKGLKGHKPSLLAAIHIMLGVGVASEEEKAEVNVAMNEMIKNDHFKIELEKWINESKKENPSIKNVITKKNVIEDANLEIEGNIKIGDKSEGQNNFDEKNTMKNVTIKGGGDFTLGDG